MEDVTFETIRDYQKAFKDELRRLGFEKSFWPRLMGDYVAGWSDYVVELGSEVKINKDYLPNTQIPIKDSEYVFVKAFGGQKGRVNVGLFFKYKDIPELVQIVLDRQLKQSEEDLKEVRELESKLTKEIEQIKEYEHKK